MHTTNRIGIGSIPRHEQHDLGLSPREEARLAEDFSTSLRALIGGTKAPKNFFAEVGQEARTRARIGDPDGDNVLSIPTNARMWQAKRDASVAGTGAYLVTTQNVSFVDLLRNRSVCLAMGATKLTGLVGNVTIPKQTAGATAYWLSSETTQITEGNQTFGQLTLSPHTVGAYTEISRLLRLQSAPEIGQIVAEDLAKQVGIAADLAALNGAGSGGEPAGLIGTAGVGTFTGTSLALAGLLNAQTDLAAANALGGSLGYVTTPAVSALLMGRVEYTGGAQPLWKGNAIDGTLAGLRAASSAQVPTDTMLLGDWSQLVIAEWGVLEIAVSNSAAAGHFQSGISAVRAMYTMDVGVRVPAAFSVATSIT